MTRRAEVLVRSFHLLSFSSYPTAEYGGRRLILFVDVGKGRVVKTRISSQERFAGRAVRYDLISLRVAEWNLVWVSLTLTQSHDRVLPTRYFVCLFVVQHSHGPFLPRLPLLQALCVRVARRIGFIRISPCCSTSPITPAKAFFLLWLSLSQSVRCMVGCGVLVRAWLRVVAY